MNLFSVYMRLIAYKVFSLSMDFNSFGVHEWELTKSLIYIQVLIIINYIANKSSKTNDFLILDKNLFKKNENQCLFSDGVRIGYFNPKICIFITFRPYLFVLWEISTIFSAYFKINIFFENNFIVTGFLGSGNETLLLSWNSFKWTLEQKFKRYRLTKIKNALRFALILTKFI